MDFSKYRQTAQEIENNFIENGRSYEDALNKIVIDLFDEMEEDYKQEQNEQLLIHGVVSSKITVLLTYNETDVVFGCFITTKKTKIIELDDLKDLNKLGNDLVDVKILK